MGVLKNTYLSTPLGQLLQCYSGFISRITEKVDAIRLFEHMATHSWDSQYQPEYKKFHGTKTVLFKVVDNALVGLGVTVPSLCS